MFTMMQKNNYGERAGQGRLSLSHLANHTWSIDVNGVENYNETVLALEIIIKSSVMEKSS